MAFVAASFVDAVAASFDVTASYNVATLSEDVAMA